MRKIPLVVALVSLCAVPLFGFRLLPEMWPQDSTPLMELSLGGDRQLADGFGSFNESAEDAFAIWNQNLAHFRFVTARDSSFTPKSGDRRNSVFFSAKIFGETFGADVLAVTLNKRSGGTITESDVLFNTARPFDSYRGPLRGILDFHRIALHEFGHVLGLDHPDDAGQKLTAAMNSHISGTDTLVADDMTGGHWLYGSPNPSPAPPPFTANKFANLSTRALVGTGANSLIGGFVLQGTAMKRVLLRAMGPLLKAGGVTDAIDDPSIELHGPDGAVIASNDDWTGNANAQAIIDTGLAPATQFESALLIDLAPGSYTAIVSAFDNSPGVALVELYDMSQNTGRALNVSTRGFVGTGNDIMIAGLVIGGSQPKPTIVRVLGPSLGSAGVAGALGDPIVELRDGAGNLVASNDNWQQGPDAAAIASAGLAPNDPHESALQATLAPGSYTALVRGVNGGTGVGLVEAYDRSSL